MIIDYVIVLINLTNNPKSIIMKNVFQVFSTLLILIFASSCVPEKIMQLEETSTSKSSVDTIVTFDPVTFEETIQLVISDETTTQKFSTDIYQTDTIITFNPDTYEETIEIVKTKIPTNKNNN